MIDYRGVIDDRHIPRLIDIVVADLGTGNILVRYKIPIVRRRIVSATKDQVKSDTRFHRRPAIVFIAVPPGDPGRRPFIAGNPHPAITIRKKPAAIVKGRPAPGIIGGPGPAVVSINPLTIGGVRLEIGTGIRQPDIPVIRILYPLPVRTQVVIKRLIGSFRLRLRRRGRHGIGLRRGRWCPLDHIDRATAIKDQAQDRQSV